MACLSSNEEFISVSCGIKTYIGRISDGECVCIDHTKLNELEKCESLLPEHISKFNNVQKASENAGLSMLCSDFSPSGDKLAFCTLAKTLCIIDITKPKLVLLNIHPLSRGASKVRFTPLTEDVVVAGKSGDVYLFNPSNAEGKLILGHVSMLLDLLFSPDERLIITCDRDNKIRVSLFPNAYNIVAYCLGHTEFVSSITLLPHDKDFLISTSGDGTVRFWNYKVGMENEVCNIFPRPKHCDAMEDDLSGITDAVVKNFNNSTSLIFICVVEKLSRCLALKCITDGNKQLVCAIIQEIRLSILSPSRLSSSSNIIWILLNCDENLSVAAVNLEERSSELTDNLTDNIEKLLNSINNGNMTIDFKKTVFRLFFKKNFDIVQEYLKRKSVRLSVDQTSNNKIIS